MSLGQQLKNFREDTNLSQSYVANKLNISRQSISNWEHDKNYPDMNNLVKLSDLYGFDLNKLLDDNHTLKNNLDDTQQQSHNSKTESFLLIILASLSYTISPIGLLLAIFIVWFNNKNKYFYIFIYVLSIGALLYNLYVAYTDITLWWNFYHDY